MAESIGVICGGAGVERDVSLRSGKAVHDALARKGYAVEMFDLTRQNFEELSTKKWSSVFVALHGQLGEDGAIQGVLEWMGIPYTGSGVRASAIGMDKHLTAEIAKTLKIHVPRTEVWTLRDLDSDRRTRLTLPIIVKPRQLGSSVGLRLVEAMADLRGDLEHVLTIDDSALLQEFIGGREVHVGLLDRRVLGLVEIVPKGKVYSETAKYGVDVPEYIIDPKVAEATHARMEDEAVRICAAIGTEGPARVDFRLNALGEPVLLEVNTLPGMTGRSLLPKVARLSGMEFDDLVEAILIGARLKAV